MERLRKRWNARSVRSDPAFFALGKRFPTASGPCWTTKRASAGEALGAAADFSTPAQGMFAQTPVAQAVQAMPTAPAGAAPFDPYASAAGMVSFLVPPTFIP